MNEEEFYLQENDKVEDHDSNQSYRVN